jgi:phosphoribosyl-AMP cyclohydrolase
VHSDSLNKALIGPLAQESPAGFLFLGREFSRFFGGRTLVELVLGKAGGLVPAIIQDDRTGDVLMLGFMNEDALAETRRTREVVFYSRSRDRLWKKGESSGHVLKVRDLRVDCDADALLIRVEAVGPGVCHEGYRSCFFRRIEDDGAPKIIAERTFEPDQVYGQEKKR